MLGMVLSYLVQLGQPQTLISETLNFRNLHTWSNNFSAEKMNLFEYYQRSFLNLLLIVTFQIVIALPFICSFLGKLYALKSFNFLLFVKLLCPIII